jgi:hypothetical protein
LITNFSSSSVRTGVKRKRFWDQNAVANSFFSIATVTVGAGGAANVEFTNIPQTYTHLQIRGIGRSSNAGNSFGWGYYIFNSDTAANYSSHILQGNGASATSASYTGATNGLQIRATDFARSGTTANTFGVTIVDILDYSNTNKYKTIRVIGGSDTNGAGVVSLASGNWRSTAAITTIKITNQTDNWLQYTSFALYGVKA